MEDTNSLLVENKVILCTVAFIYGDKLVSQEIGGFKIGSASALKCRVCMGNANYVAIEG